jgi:hypothetical protein
MPASTQFDLNGLLQEATLDASCFADAHCGGTLKVNGHVVLVPKETIVILPASALTWQELFTQAPAPYGIATAPPTTGMAMADKPVPLTTYEVHVVGNRVLGGSGGADVYIAGLVDISQNGLNSGAGFINYIDYALGEIRVGGVIGDSTTGTRVRLNDPAGRYGRAMSPDVRFTVDPDNPTIAAATGFPMCLPRVAPNFVNPDGSAGDAKCPEAQRAGQPSAIQMRDPATPGFPDARIQAPFEVGDFVNFAGTLVTDAATPTTGPWPATGTAGTYVSAHTIGNNIAIYTWPGTNPAYVSTEVTLIGTGGLTVLGAGEAAIRTRFEGMTTDPSRNIHLYGIDLDPLTGGTTDRDWGMIGVDPGPPNGAVKGRWRFRPPCTAPSGIPTDKQCSPPALGTFLPPTREMRAVIEGLQSQDPANPAAQTAANGIFYGQYHAPILEYIFPENIPGSAIVENNFNSIQFLAQGGYTSVMGTLAGQLNPWPSNVVPAPACSAALANPGGPYSVASGGSVQLSGGGTGTPPLSYFWTASSGSLSSNSVANPVFSAVGATSPVTLTLVVSNACGSSNATTTVTINAASSPTVNSVAPVSVSSGAPGSFVVTGSDPAALPLTFSVTQSGAPALANLAVTSTGASSATVTFTAPVLPIDQTASSVVTLSITASNGSAVSAPTSVAVTINPLSDAIVITNAEYRTSKQRLIITATTSVVSTNVVLKLQPYVTVSGLTFDPATLGNTFTNNGGGLYSIQLVGAPEPAVPPAVPLVVKSNIGGVSVPHGLDRIRQ